MSCICLWTFKFLRFLENSSCYSDLNNFLKKYEITSNFPNSYEPPHQYARTHTHTDTITDLKYWSLENTSLEFDNRQILGRLSAHVVFILLVHVYVCMCVYKLASQRDRRIVPIHWSIMLSPTDVTFFVAFGRKILIEEAAPPPVGSGSPLLS